MTNHMITVTSCKTEEKGHDGWRLMLRVQNRAQYSAFRSELPVLLH